MKSRQSDIVYVGTTEAMAYVERTHPRFVAPQNELFAFARHHGTKDVVYAVVAENEQDLSAVACRWVGKHGMTDDEFDDLQRTVAKEARECRIDAPYSVTFANRSGAFSFCMRRSAKKES